MLGHQARDNICLIITGHGNKSIHIYDPLKRQQIYISAISSNNKGFFKSIC